MTAHPRRAHNETGMKTMDKYRLVDGLYTVTVVKTADGADWRACVLRAGDTVEYRYFSALSGQPDQGLLRAAKELRREFGITGTYQPVNED